MGANFVQIGDEVVVDLTNDTVTPDKLASGVTAHDKSGNKITGTMSANVKIYDVTVSKAYGWILLTTLDADVLAHINDAKLIVSLTCVDAYAYSFYSGRIFIATNTQMGNINGYKTYGLSNKQANETTEAVERISYPANNTGSTTNLGGTVFRVNGGKYYIYPSDGYINGGNYRLTFTW